MNERISSIHVEPDEHSEGFDLTIYTLTTSKEGPRDHLYHSHHLFLQGVEEEIRKHRIRLNA